MTGWMNVFMDILTAIFVVVVTLLGCMIFTVIASVALNIPLTTKIEYVQPSLSTPHVIKEEE